MTRTRTPVTKPSLHLICNAHLDPVWQWEWEEGVAEAISTFRTAADLIDQFDTFIFNHNEVILYQWIEDYEPELFKRIQRLVKAGRWHIMGGWYLQPDCNMPSGEGFVRQILAGREYFKRKFGARPTTAINFDPFGHTRGLVQILAKSGYDSYLHCRPSRQACGQESNEYVWVGYDGSEVSVTRPLGMYLSKFGEAAKKLEGRMETKPERGTTVMLWGVGNHGGGPSRKDIRNLNAMIAERTDWTLSHSTPEAYFEELKGKKNELPRWEADMNPFSVGCYSSMIRVKQGYRTLENRLILVEKMASAVASQGLMNYPVQEIKEAEEDLLWTAFHDVLPGTSTAPVEEHSLQRIHHGMEILSRIRARAFYALTSGQPKAKNDTFPIFVYNPHPWEIETTIDTEFSLAHDEWDETVCYQPSLVQGGKEIPIQNERPAGNIPLECRKRVCFNATLAPGVMNRFDVTMTRKKRKKGFKNYESKGLLRVKGKQVDWAINTRSGLIQHLRIGGKDLVRKGAFKALVMNDSPDPWGMKVRSFKHIAGRFTLLTQEKSAQVSGVSVKKLKPIRVIEDGPVRTVVEAVYGFGNSTLILTWSIPKNGTEVALNARVFWNEKDKMLKLSVPTTLKDGVYTGDTAYGKEVLKSNGDEVVAQKWVTISSESDDLALSVINDGTYSSSFARGEARLTLLRSPAYTAHPIGDRPLVPNTMFRPRIDQGEHLFNFWFNAGAVRIRMSAVPREAQVHNEKPMAQWFSPCGEGTHPKPFVTLSNPDVQLAALKQAENGEGWIIRLFEPTGNTQKVQLRVQSDKRIQKTLTLQPFEIRTLKFASRSLVDTNLMEEEHKCRTQLV
ncbi:MAG: glycoside hydrolase family 38 C-terminal domain-containing protein [Lentisphaeria bacterium]|nr:glycoside hydrolase family 38 C-terminal domain-containing protein [Lentisphaeria bacterium]